jgi:hypothetical protein
MQIVIYVLAGAFILYTLLLLVAYYRTAMPGVMLLALTYGAAGGLAIFTTHWWPLVAGFVLAWILKVTGADPDAQVIREQQS